MRETKSNQVTLSLSLPLSLSIFLLLPSLYLFLFHSTPPLPLLVPPLPSPSPPFRLLLFLHSLSLSLINKQSIPTTPWCRLLFYSHSVILVGNSSVTWIVILPHFPRQRSDETRFHSHRNRRVRILSYFFLVQEPLKWLVEFVKLRLILPFCVNVMILSWCLEERPEK